MQELVPQKRIVAGEQVPLMRGNASDGVADFDDGRRRFQGKIERGLRANGDLMIY
jgi:hypothetical protein